MTTKQYALKILALTGMLIGMASPLSAQMNYQGRLTDVNGDPIAGNQATIRFSLHDAETGGGKVWGDFDVNADLLEGRFNVVVGPNDSAARSINNVFTKQLYLQITLFDNQNPPQAIVPALPRQQIINAPYALGAFNAKHAETAGHATTAANAVHATYATAIGNGSGNAPITIDFASGNVGVGTTTPNSTLHVDGDNVTTPFRVQVNGSSKLTLATNGGMSLGGFMDTPPPNGLYVEGNVGIGTSSPTKKLDVDGDVRGSFIVRQGGSYEAGSIYSDANYGMVFRSAQLNPTTSDFLFANSDNSIHHMSISKTGNVGIGTLAPGAKLDVYAPTGTTAIRMTGTGTNAQNWNLIPTTSKTLVLLRPGLRLAAFADNGDSFFGSLNTDVGGGATLTVKGTQGNVGIGTNTPTKAKLEINGFVTTGINVGGYLNRNGANDYSNTNITPNLSIYCSNDIVGTTIYANSDARIKVTKGQSDKASDLITLSHIAITDYTYKDVVTMGSQPQKKVIAQQVKKVFPQAVSTMTKEVPDIYQKATVTDGWVIIKTKLKAGERVRLIGKSGTALHKVLETRDGAFRTDSTTDDKEVFVYGREVNDFHIVDYDALAMLNVSATQELYRRLQTQGTELTTSATKISALEKRLAALESMINARPKSTPVTSR